MLRPDSVKLLVTQTRFNLWRVLLTPNVEEVAEPFIKVELLFLCFMVFWGRREHKMKSGKREKRHKRWTFFRDNASLLIVLLSFTIVLAFSVVVLVLAGRGLEVSATLIEQFFRFFGFELLALSGIKVSKNVRMIFNPESEPDQLDESMIDENSEIGG